MKKYVENCLIVLYIICGFLTFGYFYNHRLTDVGQRDAPFIAMFAGAAWPIYWAGEISLKVTE